MTNCNGARNKQAEIAELCNYTDPDAISMCETKLDKSVKSSEFLAVNYTTCFRKDRTSHGGGVLIALKSHYVAEEVDLVDIVCEIVCAKIVLRNSSPNYVGSFYHPPSDPISSLEALEVALIKISDLCKNNTKTAVVIAGDFYAGDINWDSYSVRETSTKNTGKKKMSKGHRYFQLLWPDPAQKFTNQVRGQFGPLRL